MPKCSAGITDPAGRTALLQGTVRSVSDTLVVGTRKSLDDDAHRRGCDGDSIVLYGSSAIILKQGHKLHGA